MAKARSKLGARDGREGEEDVEPTGAETVRAELARVRARFGVDPAVVSHSLAGAWISPSGAVEEDEAEFVDAVADCVSVGLPLTAAVASWASGSLADAGDDAEDDVVDDPGEGSLSAQSHIVVGRRITVR